MGIFEFLTGSKQPTIQNKVGLNSNERFEMLWEYKMEVLRNKYKQKEESINHLIFLRDKAKKFEQEYKLQEAINTYLQSINYGENCDNLSLCHYYFDIDRVIILYGKTKQKELLKEYLENNINKYPNYRGTNDWSIRLSKLT